jgi:hypothetical protein
MFIFKLAAIVPDWLNKFDVFFYSIIISGYEALTGQRINRAIWKTSDSCALVVRKGVSIEASGFVSNYSEGFCEIERACTD